MPPETNHPSPEPQEPEPIVTPSETPEPKKKQLNTPAAILIGAAFIAIAVFFALRTPSSTTQQQNKANEPQIPTSVDSKVVTIRPDDYVKGDKNAPIVVFEYSDSDCPFCAKFHPTMQQIIKESNGSIAWVYRFFPLSIHPNAYTEALALQCVGKLGGNDKFWTYLDSLITITLNPDPKSNEALFTIAKAQGIDVDAMKACTKDSSMTAQLDTDVNEAGDIGARGTPFSIAVNVKTGKQVVIPGAYPIEAVRKMIDSIK